MGAKTQKLRNLLGHNVQTLRTALGLTQLALAHKMGFKGRDAGAFICKVEAGRQEPRTSNLMKLAAALNTTVENLIS